MEIEAMKRRWGEHINLDIKKALLCVLFSRVSPPATKQQQQKKRCTFVTLRYVEKKKWKKKRRPLIKKEEEKNWDASNVTLKCIISCEGSRIYQSLSRAHRREIRQQMNKRKRHKNNSNNRNNERGYTCHTELFFFFSIFEIRMLMYKKTKNEKKKIGKDN